MESYPIYHSMPCAGACGRIWTGPMRRPEPAGAGRLVLANTLNLLPGTLSVSLEGEHLHLNVLDTRRPIVAEVRAAERHLARMLGLQLAA
jgi:hypothetical protein